MAVEATLDHLAFTFRKLGVKQITLEDLARRADVTIFGISAQALQNAMMTRGILIENGFASEYEGHVFKNTLSISFRKFSERAAEIIQAAERPIMPSDLIGMVGLVEGAVPMSSMSYHLRKVGIWFIPGVGYWHQKQFVDEDGTLYGSIAGNEQSTAMMQAFKEYGWPMTSADLEAAAPGKVTRRYIVTAVKRPWPDIISVGYGLYVPSGAARRASFPMSKNIAQAFLDLSPRDVIDSKDNTRMYRICDLLQRSGYGIKEQSNTVRDGKQRRIAYFHINESGRKALAGLVNDKKPDDEF